MKRLVFIDDDEEELKCMRKIVGGAYEYTQLHWPRQKPTKRFVGAPPAIFVSDLYLPPADHGGDPVDHPPKVLKKQAASAKRVGNCFPKLYPGPRDAKQRLRETMKCLKKARDLLDEQWKELSQSPKYGLKLLKNLRAHPVYGKVPFVFYSRKITPEDVVNVLKAGATAAIRKQDWRKKEDFLVLLRRAQSVYCSGRAKRARRFGMNVNTTLFPN